MDAVSFASSILTRAVTLDTSQRYTESLVCYQEGIQILFDAIKNLTNEEQKAKIKTRLEDFMTRAEKVKSHIENLKTKGEYREQVQIEEDSTGHSYDKVFSRFLDAAVCRVEVDDPYIRAPHQCDNFLRFTELCLKSCVNLKVIFLKTKKDESNHADQLQRLASISKSLKKYNVNVQIDYSDTIHDREIRLDNGWVIKIGRGLDYFKKPAERYSIGYNDFYFRSCRATIIDVFHKKDLVRLS